MRCISTIGVLVCVMCLAGCDPTVRVSEKPVLGTMQTFVEVFKKTNRGKNPDDRFVLVNGKLYDCTYGDCEGVLRQARSGVIEPTKYPPAGWEAFGADDSDPEPEPQTEAGEAIDELLDLIKDEDPRGD